MAASHSYAMICQKGGCSGGCNWLAFPSAVTKFSVTQRYSAGKGLRKNGWSLLHFAAKVRLKNTLHILLVDGRIATLRVVAIAGYDSSSRLALHPTEEADRQSVMFRCVLASVALVL